jgi:hypothetical protein
MTPTELVIERGAEVTAEAQTWPAQAKALQVVDAATYVDASEMLKGIKALRGKIAETFDPHIARAFDAHRALVREKREAEAPLLDAELIIKRGLTAFDQEQERLRLIEERRRQEEARRIEEARQLEEAAALEREATATGDGGLLAEAEEMFERPVYVPPVTVARTTPKVAGIVHRETWSAKVVSLPALIKFVAAHPEHQNLLTPNLPALNSLARSMKTNLKVDGVHAICEKGVAAGR